jgi:hypothetical protein
MLRIFIIKHSPSAKLRPTLFAKWFLVVCFFPSFRYRFETGTMNTGHNISFYSRRGWCLGNVRLLNVFLSCCLHFLCLPWLYVYIFSFSSSKQKHSLLFPSLSLALSLVYRFHPIHYFGFDWLIIAAVDRLLFMFVNWCWQHIL